MQAIILLAGYGSRLDRDDLPHKALLPFGEETLLSRHLTCMQEMGIKKTHLVVGHNKEHVKNYVEGLNPDQPVAFIDNDLYLTTGNTLSLVMGLEKIQDDVLIMDGDVLYPKSVLAEFVRKGKPSSFAVVGADINDEECSKMLLNPDGTIGSFVTKRLMTEEELERYQFAGEAIGFIKLTQDHVRKFEELYYRNEPEYSKTLWEIPFTEFVQSFALHPWTISTPHCFEIDTPEDYQDALSHFERNKALY